MGIRSRTLFLYLVIISFTIASYLLLLNVSRSIPILLGLGFLSYVLGLRHGVDADHIIAIDNATRKLMHDGQKPVENGFFFSMGHSAVVIAMVFVVVVTSKAAFYYFYNSRSLLGLVGTLVSAAFLYIIAGINLTILLENIREYRDKSKKKSSRNIMPKGFMGTLFNKAFKSMHSSWELFPIGLLFGLGFDTATEVTLLGISATQAGNSIPTIYILVLPLMFASGMMIVDSSDSVFMVQAYAWALADKSRRSAYNMVITGISVFVAFLIATVELLSLFPSISSFINNFNFNEAGFVIIGIFMAFWVFAFLFYHIKKRKSASP